MDIEPLFQLFRFFRRRRMKQFYREFAITPQTRVLDVGGREFNWNLMSYIPRVTILNVSSQGERDGRFEWILADARQLPFSDGAFDVIYSNSVIEHCGGTDDQRRFAAECRRVGRRYYVQTPNRRFFLEPHVFTPFFHWLPRRWQAPLLRNFTVWGWITRPDEAARRRFLETTRMLSKSDVQTLFPDATIWTERFLGLPKSFIAVRLTSRPAASVPPVHRSG